MKDNFTHQEILEAFNACMIIGQMNVPQKTAFKLATLIRTLRPIAHQIEKDKMDLYKKHGKEEKAGSGMYKIPDEEFTKFTNEIMQPFMDQKTEEIEFQPIPCNHFQSIPAQCIVAMGKFMTEEERITTLQ